MKRKLTILAAFVLVAALATVGAFAQATGDFKVASATYLTPGDADGGDVTISGTVNHGAIQSGKSVVIEVSYQYSFEYQITTSTTVTTPARCPNPNDRACRSNDGSANWQPKTETVTVTQTLDAAGGLTAITAPTVTNGRLNPRGRVTGYNWARTVSIVPSDSIVDPDLIPVGATLVSGSVQITSVSYSAYLVDTASNQIADTVNSGNLFAAP